MRVWLKVRASVARAPEFTFNKVVELKLPTEHEHVMLSLWRLGLQRDPAKYTLRELNAVISYDTAWEHQMTSLVSVNETLQDTLMLLQHMMAPPEPIAAGLRAGVVAGVYKTGKAFLTDLEMQVDKNAVYEATMYFPLSGEIVDAMVDASDWLVCYVQHGVSNSRKILEYAIRRENKQQIQILNMADTV